MRTLYVLALAAAASFATFSTAAAQAPDAAGPAGTTIQVTGVPMARYRLDTEGFNYYKGTYELSNGKYMRVSNRGKRFFAEIDGERRAELIPVGRNVFIAPGADMIMLFDEVYNGRMNDVVIRPRRQVG
ncbi:hypothetical protein ACFSQU_03640 [Massilia sp. GCM10020059]|uniref:Copper resistance protein K n=1 Tax=Massilia agrisoli TaxID=2892444 RepID=A0ABS8IQ78_9BURK|nr:hypothetical protein [Massilia agrisoli]MCC6070008.1 hypothetical protein [Massilia agrisoli]